MKAFKEVLNYFNEFAFYDHYNIERVIDINHVRDCVCRVLNKCSFKKDYEFIRVLDDIDNISLIIMVGRIKNLV